MDIIKDIPTGKQYISIKLSGGCDSSIIYYALCRKFSDNEDVNIIVLTLNTDKKYFYIPTAKKIIDAVYKITGKLPIEHITKTIPHDAKNYISEQNKMEFSARLKYNPIHCYSGLTMNPPNEQMVEFFKNNYKQYNLDLDKLFDSLNSRDINRDNTQFLSNNYYINPFGTNNKKYVAQCYEYYNMKEELYPITRSCEDFSDKEEHCGTCFFCAERLWGFGRLV